MPVPNALRGEMVKLRPAAMTDATRLTEILSLVPAPPPGARERGWERVVDVATRSGKNGRRDRSGAGNQERETPVQATETFAQPRFAPIPIGRTDPRHGRMASLLRPLRRGLGSAVSLAAAAVLLLTLAGGLLAIRLNNANTGSDDRRFGSVPAALVSPEASPPTGPVAFLWESRGDPADPLGNPAFLAVAPDGTVWVADGDHDRFQIFAPDGTHLETWGATGSGEGQFDFTAAGWGGYHHGAIAFAPDGGFYVADPGNFRIQRFGPDRRLLTAWGSEGQEPGQFRTPNDLVVDGQGRVYVLDSDRPAAPAVQVFDADGRFLAAWGERGPEPGHLDGPSGIGLDPHDGTILVAEYGGNRAQRFTPGGALLRVIGGVGTADGLFAHTRDAAVDAAGRVYVTDYLNSRVQVFDRDGAFLAAWGEYGTDAGAFAWVLGVAIGGDGTIYVTDAGRRLQAFRVGDLPEPAASPTP